jgi:hypothetical protein
MDAVILAFSRATAGEVWSIAHAHMTPESTFYCDEYSGEEFTSEYEAEERARIVQLLGRPPSFMMAVSASRGPGAQQALQFIIACRQLAGCFVCDNDHGVLITGQEIASRVGRGQATDIFGL